MFQGMGAVDLSTAMHCCCAYARQTSHRLSRACLHAFLLGSINCSRTVLAGQELHSRQHQVCSSGYMNSPGCNTCHKHRTSSPGPHVAAPSMFWRAAHPMLPCSAAGLPPSQRGPGPRTCWRKMRESMAAPGPGTQCTPVHSNR